MKMLCSRNFNCQDVIPIGVVKTAKPHKSFGEKIVENARQKEQNDQDR